MCQRAVLALATEPILFLHGGKVALLQMPGNSGNHFVETQGRRPTLRRTANCRGTAPAGLTFGELGQDILEVDMLGGVLCHRVLRVGITTSNTERWVESDDSRGIAVSHH